MIDEATDHLANLRGITADDTRAQLHRYASLALELRIRVAGATAAVDGGQ